MRKWINILREFQMLDLDRSITTDGGDLPPRLRKDDGGGEPGKVVIVFDIIWDTHDAELDEKLPKRVTIPMDELDEVTWPSEDGGPDGDMMTRIGDWLTENIHGNLSNFNYTIV